MLRHAVLSLGICLWTLVNLGLQRATSAEVSPSRQPPRVTNSRISATWQGQQLEFVLQRLSASQGMELWIDRRVDLQQKVNLRLSSASLSDALTMLCTTLRLGYSRVGKVIYIGPQSSAAEVGPLLEMVQQSLDQISPKLRRRWLQAEPVSWSRLSEPRPLLQSWLDQAGVHLEQADWVTHDLWPARHYQALSLTERVVLLLVGYDLTCQISPDGKKCTVVRCTGPLIYSRSYAFSARQREGLGRFRERFPDATVELSAKELTLRGNWKQHQALSALLEPPPSPSQTHPPLRTKRQVYSLRLENRPLGDVLDQLAAQWEVTVTWSPQVRTRSNELRAVPISCEVSEVSESELLRAILDPVGLTCRRSGQALEILPAD